MGLKKFIAKAVPIAGPLIGKGIDMLSQSSANKTNKRIAREQMAFQERMRNTEYQAATKDMLAAGLNPMLAYSQGGASVPSGASTTVQPVATNSARAIEQSMALAQTAATIKATDAQARKTTAEANLTEQTTLLTADKVKWEAINTELSAQLISEQINNARKQGLLTEAQEKQIRDMLPQAIQGQRLQNKLNELAVPSAQAGAEFWKSLDADQGGKQPGDWLQEVIQWLFKARNAAK